LSAIDHSASTSDCASSANAGTGSRRASRSATGAIGISLVAPGSAGSRTDGGATTSGGVAGALDAGVLDAGALDIAAADASATGTSARGAGTTDAVSVAVSTTPSAAAAAVAALGGETFPAAASA
jgi:hypothetical protein